MSLVVSELFPVSVICRSPPEFLKMGLVAVFPTGRRRALVPLISRITLGLSVPIPTLPSTIRLLSLISKSFLLTSVA